MIPLLALISLVVACGASTGLDTPPPPDASPDAEPPAELEVDCGRMDQYTTPGRPLLVQATVSGGTAPLQGAWLTSVEDPITPLPETGFVTSVIPREVGEWPMSLTVTDAAGESVVCEYIVHSIVGPPVALCPEGTLRVIAGEPLTLDGDAFDDTGEVSYAWSVLDQPEGSDASITPSDVPDPVFQASVAGDHIVELEVTDMDLNQASCTVVVVVTGPPEVICPTGTLVGPTRQPISITATATDDTAGVTVLWEMLSRPAESMAEPEPRDRRTTRVFPDRPGDYQLRFTATDEDGLSSSCLTNLMATPSGPDARCPSTVETTPLTMVELRGDGIDDGSITAYRWTLIESPAGSAARPPSPSDARVTQFLPDVAGDYRIRLEVTDNDGNVGECDFLVSAIPREGLRIEIFWNGPVDRSCDTMPGAGCDDTDVDLHLLRPGTEAWFNSRADCHYANCIDGRLNWGDSSTVDDNPSLDIDDVEGFGPENINIEEPALGVYRVGVHLFDGGSRRDADVTVNIFCGAGSTTPVATFGPVELDEGVGPNDFWKVADVEIQSVGCAVRDLAVGGVPAIVTDRDARASR